jgi:hypothetical protein
MEFEFKEKINTYKKIDFNELMENISKKLGKKEN